MFGLKNIFKKTYSVALALSIVCCISPAAITISSVGGDNAVQVGQEELRELANELAVLVNEERAANGLQPLYIVPHLSDYSHVRVRESVRKFSHFRPSQSELSGSASDGEGESFDQYLRDEDFPFLKAAENLAAAQDPCSPEDALAQWMNSDEGHRESILDPEMTHMGVAVTFEQKDRTSEEYQSSPYEWYWEILLIDVQKDSVVVDDPDEPGMKKRIYYDKELDGQYLPVRFEIVPVSTGDLSGDSVIDSFDYVAILQYIEYQDALAKQKAGKDADEEILSRPVYFNDLQIEAADCFKDGIININDAKALQKYVLGEYKSLPYVF